MGPYEISSNNLAALTLSVWAMNVSPYLSFYKNIDFLRFFKAIADFKFVWCLTFVEATQ